MQGQGTMSAPVEARPRPWRRGLSYLLQALWIASAVLIVQLLLFSIRPGYAQLSTVCRESPCLDGQLTPEGVESLSALDISIHAYAVIQLVIVFGVALIYAIVSLLIFRARRNDPIALYIALVLLFFGVFVSDYVQVLREIQPALTALVDILPGVTLIAFAILCYVFPDGRFVPRWTRWAALAWVLAPIVMLLALIYDLYDAAVPPISFALLVLLGTCILAPIYRYRKLSSYAQRQQLKWVLFGLIQLVTTMLIVVEILPLLFPTLDVTGSLPNLVSNFFQAISLMIFPVTVGIGLLRYRLWNVDLVLNRTLVYVPLTSILTVIYTTSMAVSQRLFVTATGEQSQAVAIFTTIVLTTTFSPIKNSLQSYVDRHFKEAPGQLKEIKELNNQLTQVLIAFDHKIVAQRVVEAIVKAQQAQGAALYLCEGKNVALAHATPDWVWEEGEVSILLQDESGTLGRLLLGRRRDRDDYTLEEVEEIRNTTLPIVQNMHKLMAIQAAMIQGEEIQDKMSQDQEIEIMHKA